MAAVNHAEAGYHRRVKRTRGRVTVGAERKLGFEGAGKGVGGSVGSAGGAAERAPAVAVVAVGRGGGGGGGIVLEINAGVVPAAAVATVAGFHAD